MQPQDVSSPDGLFINQLSRTLRELTHHRYPHVPNPPGCKKRASVALIIRVRPTFPDRASFNPEICGRQIGSDRQQLENFFSQGWVQRGDPEVLFIKRAAREGDRWTSHIAFPGGRRDPEDHDDHDTSIRETREEIGLDLNAEHCLLVGNLSERIVTTWLGRTPSVIFLFFLQFIIADCFRLMVLCPFVYLLMRFDIDPLSLQPSEVHSAHWVSLRALLSPRLNTYTSSDVSGRFGRSDGYFARGLARLLFGRILIKAINLVPTESIYCSSSSDFLPLDRENLAYSSHKLLSWSPADKAWQNPSHQLILWGLTLGNYGCDQE